MVRLAAPPPPVAPVTRDQDRVITVLHILTPTSQFQRTNSSSTNINNHLRLRREGPLSHQLLSTLLMSANNPITLLKQHQRPHIITIINHPQLQGSNPLCLYRRSLTPAPRRHRGVIPSLHPFRSAQACPSHSHQSGNCAQLSLQTSFAHRIIIVKTHIRWSLHPVCRRGTK